MPASRKLTTVLRNRIKPFNYPAWIEVEGFKSIRSPVRIELRPITLLAGPNSSGKSSVFQPLLLLKQSLEVPYDPDPLVLDGPHVAFTAFDQFLWHGRTKDSKAESFGISFGPMVNPRKSNAQKSGKPINVKLLFRREKSQRERFKRKTYVREDGDSKWIEVGKDSLDEVFKLMGLEPVRANGPIISEHPLYSEISNWTLMSLLDRDVDRLPIRDPVEWLGTIFHLPGHRGHRERRYSITKVTRNRVGGYRVAGPMIPYTASLLLDWGKSASDDSLADQKKKDARRKLEQIDTSLKQLGLTWKVSAKQANAAELELRVGRTKNAQQGGAQDLVDLADAGFGLSQILPVLVALVAAQPGQMVLIEQPELHLHPQAQLAMGGVIADAAKRGVIVVVETHSQLVLRAIQTVVAKGVLKPESVGLHWFARDEESGESQVTRADLKPDGTFGDWPVDFPDIFAMADREFVDAVFGNHDQAR